MASTDALAPVFAHIEANRSVFLDRLIDYLRHPSISAENRGIAEVGNLLLGMLTQIGLETSLVRTEGHPMVVARWEKAPGKPTVLLYGHYDVQPAEPMELWTSPPFEPVLVDGPNGKRAVARGAVDDKGQVMTWLEALRFWHDTQGGPPCRITVMVEGEEEVGSKHLPDFLEANADALRDADVVVISDSNMWDVATPSIVTSVRGLVYTQVDITAANKDLHSGLFGGSALNPINLITRVLGDLKDEAGTILIPGFYDGVQEISAERRKQWDGLNFDEKAFLGSVGLSVPAGEVDRTALERLWARPTADVNGIWGGYTGEGAKTVIPSEAHAKVSFRLVQGQSPAKVLAGFRDFIIDRIPEDAQVKIQVFSHGEGIEIPSDSPFVRAAQAVLTEEFGKPAILQGGGGSLPVVEQIKQIIGLDCLLVGFGLDDDQVHSPNEKFDVVCFERGIDSHIRMLAALAEA